MLCSGLADRRIGAPLKTQCVGELIKEQWNAELEFRIRCAWQWPGGNPRPASGDDLHPVRGDKLVQHDRTTPLTFWHGSDQM